MKIKVHIESRVIGGTAHDGVAVCAAPTCALAQRLADVTAQALHDVPAPGVAS